MRDGDIIHGLVRGLSVIECFDEEHARMSITAVAQRPGLERAPAPEPEVEDIPIQ